MRSKSDSVQNFGNLNFDPVWLPYKSISHYDASLCGGFIVLENVTDAVNRNSTVRVPRVSTANARTDLLLLLFRTFYPGSDFQVEIVYQEYSDRRDITILPDGFTSSAGGLNETSIPINQRADCGNREVHLSNASV